jgi:phenylpyruvate tautomerase PptA (4-oxalocrotonate tautomerase family)
MPVGHLDVPMGADREQKEQLVKAMYDAMHEAYPFPDDTRIFLREWPLDSVSQNGQLGSEPARPVFVVHVPREANNDAKRTMLAKVNAAVAEAYPLPDIAIFLIEHSLDTVVINGRVQAEDRQRVEDQREAYA